MFSGHGRPGHEFGNSIGWMTVGQAGEGFGQPGVWIDAGELAVLDERCDDRPVVATFVRAEDRRAIGPPFGG